MKNFIIIGLVTLGVAYVLQGCNLIDFYEDINKDKDDASPKLSIGTISLVTDPTKTSNFLADGTSLLKVPITLTPATTVVENRKVTLTTTVGDFVVGSEIKKSIEIILNENGTNDAYIKAPNAAASGVVTASTVNVIATDQKNIAFVAVAAIASTLSIDKISLVENSAVTSGFLADGTALLKVDIKLTPSNNTAANRKVTLTTTTGDFVVGSESKKSIEITLKENGLGEVYLKSPSVAASGVITASLTNGFVSASTKTISFAVAVPENVEVETPQSILASSSVTPITVHLIRNSGMTSEGQRGVFQLLLNNQVITDGVSFIESTASQNGLITAKLVLEKIPVGKYKLRVTVGGNPGEKPIEVK